MSERVELTVEALKELVRRQDAPQAWVNLQDKQGVYGRAVRLTWNNYTVATRDDPELTVELIERGGMVRTACVLVSEIFDLVPNVRAIVAERARVEAL